MGDVISELSFASLDDAAKKKRKKRDVLLAFARRQSLDIKSADINGLFGGMMNILRRGLGKNVALETKLKDDLWSALTGDVGEPPLIRPRQSHVFVKVRGKSDHSDRCRWSPRSA